MTCSVIQWKRTDSGPGTGTAFQDTAYDEDAYLFENDPVATQEKVELVETLGARMGHALIGADDTDAVQVSPNWAGERLRSLQARGFRRINNPRDQT